MQKNYWVGSHSWYSNSMMSSRTRLFAFSAPFSSVLGFCLHSSKMAAISCIMSTTQVQNDKNIAVEFLSRMPGRAAAILLPSQKSHMLKTMEEEEKMRWDICIILLLEKVFEKWYERWPLQGKKKASYFYMRTPEQKIYGSDYLDLRKLGPVIIL